MEPVDTAELLRKAELRDQKFGSGVFRFAEAIDVEITPANSGTWETLPDGRSIWRMRLSSPGAQSLNLGFLKYRMPDGGQLSIFPPDLENNRPIRDFTAADNEAHEQLWTPIFRGDELALEVVLPAGIPRDELALTLAKVNHGFRGLKADKIGGDTSGACNIDVACTNDPTVGNLIQAYADQIRSVGAYTLGGVDTCSGALINNTNNDGTPYFLTAEHCGISPANAPSMVVYFNFENSTCRTPGSAESGQVGDGDLSQFNSGAIHRAENAASDFCLVELDDPIPPAYNVFFSGWDRAFTNGPATGIHHPAVAEKRISFDLDDTVDDGATHVRVLDWNHGTTEGGSSGSPLYNLAGRIIGDLTGGNAACGNDEYDTYGRISVSWTGGGTTATRLSDWLDPASSGVTQLDGVNQDDTLSINDVQITEGNSGTQNLEFTVNLVRSGNETITVQYQTFDGTATTANSDYAAASGTLTFNPSDTSKTVSVTINGDTTPEEHESFEVRLSNPTNAQIGDATGVGTINNDDFITPVITSSLNASGFNGEAFSYQIAADNTPTSFAISNEPAGMSVDPATGLVSWTPPSSGNFTATITATNPAGSDNETLTINVNASSLQVAIDSSRAFSQSAQTWTLQTAVTHDGVDAARSPAISHSQTAYFETTVNTGSGGDAVSFWWKVSSEDGFDFLRFLVNGTLIQSISGEVDWTQVNHALAADSSFTIRIEYAKDGSVSNGSDAGFVDEFELGSDSPLPTFTSPSQASGVVDEPFSFDVEALGATSYSASNLPNGLSINSGTGEITGTPDALGQTTATITATNATGSTIQQLLISITPSLPNALDSVLPQVAWSSSGPELWFGQTGTTHDGVDAAQSGGITHSESSTLTANVNFDGAQTLSFWWKVSSESGFDFLRFNINGTQNESISGEVDWTRETGVTIPAGAQVLTWVFQKDGSVSNGSDAGWLDEVVFAWKLAAPGNFTATDGTIYDRIRLNWDAVGGATSYRIFRGVTSDLSSATQIATVPAGTLTYDDMSAAVGQTYHFWVRAFNATDQLGDPAATDTGSITPDGPMTVTSLDPDRGRPGVVVTINGTNLDTVRSARFGGVNAIFVVVSASEITVTVPNGFPNGPITLTNNTNTVDTPNFTLEQTFSEWLAAQAAAAGATLEPGTVEELAARDEDGDGFNNGEEFGLGGNPFVADSALLRSQIDNSVDPPVFRFNRAIAHLNYEVQTTGTLAEGSWTARATNPGSVGGLVEVQLQAAWGFGGQLFARVVVSGFE